MLGEAREHYQTALALDPTNRIAERNIDRLKILLNAAGEKTVPAQEGSKAPVSIFVEETGKTGFAFLTDLANPKELAQVNPGDAVELTPEKNRLIAFSNGMRIGVVEPRVAARLLKLMADGNKYAAGVTSLGDKDVRLIIREIFQDPSQLRQGQLPDGRQVDRPAARTPRAPSCARRWSSRRTSRTTRRTRRSRTSIASCRRSRRPRRPSRRSPTSSTRRRPSGGRGRPDRRGGLGRAPRSIGGESQRLRARRARPDLGLEPAPRDRQAADEALDLRRLSSEPGQGLVDLDRVLGDVRRPAALAEPDRDRHARPARGQGQLRRASGR